VVSLLAFKVELALGDQPTALRLINEALNHPDATLFKASFFEHRAEVRKLQPGAEIEDLFAAYDACKNDTHRESLSGKIANCRG